MAQSTLTTSLSCRDKKLAKEEFNVENAYVNSIIVNGTETQIQDYGRDQPNGVPVLDTQGKLPTKYIPDNIGSNSYSTDEVKTGGKWIDGKPIYRKTISCGALPNNAIKHVALGINNLRMIISSSGFATDNLTLYMPIPVSFPDGVSASFYITKKDIVLNTTTDYTYYSDTYITLEYTKTTD